MAVLESTVKGLMTEINRLIDSGETLSIEQTREVIENYETVQFLSQEFEEIDLSLIVDGDHIDEDEVNQLIFQWADGLRGRTGIQNNGLNLLLAVLIEMFSSSEDLQESP